VACLPVPRAYVFSSLLFFSWRPPLLFLVKKCFTNDFSYAEGVSLRDALRTHTGTGTGTLPENNNSRQRI
jgi:hypothetical protein